MHTYVVWYRIKAGLSFKVVTAATIDEAIAKVCIRNRTFVYATVGDFAICEQCTNTN